MASTTWAMADARWFLPVPGFPQRMRQDPVLGALFEMICVVPADVEGRLLTRDLD
ncbi:hypothetical protein GGI1_23276, partial [Acidithiobacillus sp. GGI-221]